MTEDEHDLHAVAHRQMGEGNLQRQQLRDAVVEPELGAS